MTSSEWWTLIGHAAIAVVNLITLYMRLKSRQD
jgi:hypothetical protein